MSKNLILLSVIAAAICIPLPGEAENQAQVINVANSLNLNGDVAGRLINVGQDVTGQDCRITGLLNAGGSVTLSHCDPVGGIRAGAEVSLTGSRVESEVVAGKRVHLQKTSVGGRVVAPAAVVVDSTIQDSLHTADRHLVLDGSSVGNVVVNLGGNSVVLGKSSIVGNGSVIVKGGGSVVSVGDSGTVKANNFTIEGRPGQTIVITPEGYVYSNGKRSSEEGPATYEDYQAEHPSAPSIQGPSWASGSVTETSKDAPAAIVELINGSIINGDITFRNGHGVVILSGDSKLNGNISGGTLQQK